MNTRNSCQTPIFLVRSLEMGTVKSCCQNKMTAVKRKKGIAFYFLESCLVFIAVRCDSFSYLIEVKITVFCDNSVICWKALASQTLCRCIKWEKWRLGERVLPKFIERKEIKQLSDALKYWASSLRVMGLSDCIYFLCSLVQQLLTFFFFSVVKG